MSLSVPLLPLIIIPLASSSSYSSSFPTFQLHTVQRPHICNHDDRGNRRRRLLFLQHRVRLLGYIKLRGTNLTDYVSSRLLCFVVGPTFPLRTSQHPLDHVSWRSPISRDQFLLLLDVVDEIKLSHPHPPCWNCGKELCTCCTRIWISVHQCVGRRRYSTLLCNYILSLLRVVAAAKNMCPLSWYLWHLKCLRSTWNHANWSILKTRIFWQNIRHFPWNVPKNESVTLSFGLLLVMGWVKKDPFLWRAAQHGN